MTSSQNTRTFFTVSSALAGFFYAITLDRIARTIAEAMGASTKPEWAIVRLMGRMDLYGQVKRHRNYVEILAFDPEKDDRQERTFCGWGAVFKIDPMPEGDVRRDYVRHYAPYSGMWSQDNHAWQPSSVCPQLCRHCASERHDGTVTYSDDEIPF